MQCRCQSGVFFRKKTGGLYRNRTVKYCTDIMIQDLAKQYNRQVM